MRTTKTTSQDSNRTNALVRAVLFCICFTVILVLLSIFRPILPEEYERFAYGLTGMTAALITTYIFLRLEKRSFADIGLIWQRKTLTKFLIGFFIGLLLTTLMFACLILFGRMELALNPRHNLTSFLFGTLALVPLALMEELAFRAYPFLTLNRALGLRASLLITSILFAIYHIVSGWSVAVSLLGPGVWGLIFGLAAAYGKGIAMPTGIHYAANLTQAAIGMKKIFEPIWTLRMKDDPAVAHRAEVIGYGVQLLLFLLAVVSIEWYRRKRSSTNEAGAVNKA